MQPIMRPIFKTPGRSAVDMVADLAGVFLPLLCIRNRAKRHPTKLSFICFFAPNLGINSSYTYV
ncbi:hypothetical protein P4601_12325 [Peribacillus frigoritolerans]|nr:hypothetical protein [Peribacillus frigoritolerans]MED3711742.1 hypothetical protein [Peribacillus frigoritolerans]MED3890717.1 hypothetical protein [Peribacillus frigoritolerans]ULM97788.1 hypothetical protein L8956_03315 [Peribacillus frigoritolerans]